MDNFDLYEWNQKRRLEQIAIDELRESTNDKNTKTTNISLKSKK